MFFNEIKCQKCNKLHIRHPKKRGCDLMSLTEFPLFIPSLIYLSGEGRQRRLISRTRTRITHFLAGL